MSCSSVVALDVSTALLQLGPSLLWIAVPRAAGGTIVLEVTGLATTSVGVCKSLPFLGERAATPQQLNRLASDSATDRRMRPVRLRGFNFILTLCYACSN